MVGMLCNDEVKWVGLIIGPKVVHEVEVKRGPRNMTFCLFYGRLDDVKIDPRWWAWKFDMPFLHHSMKEGYKLLRQNSLSFGSIPNKRTSPFPLAFRMY
jgi:hypothetical protein